ncbi:MAG: hypothetical protein P8184_12760, partial [Calditrichia bacterium]
MSHRLLLILVVFGFSFSQVYAAKANKIATLTPTVQLSVKAAKSIYKNGDRIEVRGTGFPANAEIMSAVMIVRDESGKNSFGSLEKKDLQIGPDGTLSGYVIPQQLTENDRSARIVLSVKGANVKASQAVTIEGDLTPTNFAMLDLSDDQFAFSEFSGDHVVQLNERLDIDSSGTGFTGNLLACYRLEYADAVGGGVDSLTNFNQDAIQALDPTSLHFDGGMLTGYTNSTETPYAPATESIRLAIQYGTLAFGNTAVSIDYISTLDNIPPQLISARTIDPTHIEVTFDEQLTVPAVNGDAIDNWSLTSQGGTNYSVNAVSNLGETVISCTLNVTPALNRSQRPLLNFTQQTDYQDLQGNAAATVSNLQATDGIPPGNVVLFLGDDNNPLSIDD